MIELFLGGVRSGKSRLAEQRITELQRPVVYVATATVGDSEMSKRVSEHQKRRPDDWYLVEEPVQMQQAIADQSGSGCVLLVDCLTLWTTNLLMSHDEHLCERKITALLDYLPKHDGDVVFVSNEVGTGVVPVGELSRRFVDESGLLHQRLAAICNRVVYCVAGLPMILKDIS